VVVSLADDFEDGNANGWVPLSGTWSVMTDGSSVFTQSDSAAAQFHAYRGSPTWTNYGIEARIKVMTFGSSGSAALRARFTDVDNNYYLVVNGTQAVLKKRKNGITTTLSTQPFVANLGTWYKVKLVATGANIEGWIDGVRVISVVDSDPLPGGFAVLAGHNVDVRFDDVIVE
jgi:pectate lyase